MEIFLKIICQSGQQLMHLMPFVLLGCLSSSMLLWWKSSRWIDHLRGMSYIPLILGCASLGIISPFCTLGTVPLVIGLIGRGFPEGGGIAFLAASSMANPQMSMVQYATMGPWVTALQGVSALVIGVIVGCITKWCEQKGIKVINSEIPIQSKSTFHHRPMSFFQHFLNQFQFVLIIFSLVYSYHPLLLGGYRSLHLLGFV